MHDTACRRRAQHPAHRQHFRSIRKSGIHPVVGRSKSARYSARRRNYLSVAEFKHGGCRPRGTPPLSQLVFPADSLYSTARRLLASSDVHDQSQSTAVGAHFSTITDFVISEYSQRFDNGACRHTLVECRLSGRQQGPLDPQLGHGQ